MKNEKTGQFHLNTVNERLQYAKSTITYYCNHKIDMSMHPLIDRVHRH